MFTPWSVALLTLLPLAGAEPVAPGQPAQANAPVLLQGHGLRDATAGALRRWANVDDARAREAAQEFLPLYKSLLADRKLAAIQRESLRLKVRRRLLTLKNQIERHLAASQQVEPKDPETVDILRTTQTLNQMGRFGPPPVNRPGPLGPIPDAWGGRAAGARTANDDYGDDLVKLIEDTVAPGTWNVRGGPGSMYYWRHGRAIVVRQTEEVHRNLSDVFDQLHRAGQ